MVLPITFDQQVKPGNEILAGDIGATKSNLSICRWTGSKMVPGKLATYKSKNFADLLSMIIEFVGNTTIPPVVCMAVAGPVLNGRVRLTNLSWQADSQLLSRGLNDVSVVLVNDLEAAAYGLAMLDDHEFHTLNEGQSHSRGNAAIIAPGTGLGEAGLYYDGERYLPFATEGGHSSFSPRLPIDVELFQHLQKQFGHVSWERVLSGPGLLHIYDFLYKVKDWEEPSWLAEKMLTHDPARIITEYAEECAICKETVEMFIRYLAEESASLVLKLKATGGLFIGGGILPHILRLVNRDSFMKFFSEAGRLKSLLKEVPVKIIMNDTAPMLGAAYYGIHKT